MISHVYYTRLSIADIYRKQNRYDEADRVIDEALAWGQNNNINVYREGIYLKSILAIHDNDIETLLTLDDAVIATLAPIYKNCIFAYRNALHKDAKSAQEYLDLALQYVSDSQDALDMYHYGYIVHKVSGNYERALREHENFLEAQDNMLRSALQQPLLTIQRDYYQAHSEIQSLKLRNSRNISVFVCILILILITELIKYYRDQLARKQEELGDYLTLHEELKKSLSDRNVEIESMDGRIRNLFSDHFKLLDKLCSICYESPNSTKEKDAIYTKIKKEIESFRTDKKILAELEEIVNMYNNDVMRKLREGMPDFTEMEYRLLCFFYAGFSAKAISIFTGNSTDNIYVKKTRLKDRILKAKPADWQEITYYLS